MDTFRLYQGQIESIFRLFSCQVGLRPMQNRIAAAKAILTLLSRIAPLLNLDCPPHIARKRASSCGLRTVLAYLYAGRLSSFTAELRILYCGHLPRRRVQHSQSLAEAAIDQAAHLVQIRLFGDERGRHRKP